MRLIPKNLSVAFTSLLIFSCILFFVISGSSQSFSPNHKSFESGLNHSNQIADFKIYGAVKKTGSDDVIPPPPLLENIRVMIKGLAENPYIPSIAVGVSYKHQIIWQEAFGLADIENEIPATPQTMYSVASVTKPLTAAAILRLAEMGKLHLDNPVNQYLSGTQLQGFAGNADSTTVRRVLNHTGGLPLHYQFFYSDAPYERPDMEETIRRYGILTFRPGDRYQYSNIGYGILDHVIQTVSGKSYSEFMEQEIFRPLGMNNSYVGIPAEKNDKQAVRYGNEMRPLPFYDFDHRGASAVYSTVHDLLRFGIFSIGHKRNDQTAILADSTRKTMLEKSTASMGMGNQSGYALGWSITEHESGLQEVWHSGGMAGVRTILILIPEADIVVTVLHNSNSSTPLMLARDIVYLLLPDRFDEPKRVITEAEEFDSSSIAGMWEGKIKTYAGEKELFMDVDENGEITVVLERNDPVQLARTYFDEYGFLRGVFFGNIGTIDINRFPYILYLNARPEDHRMYGSITAISIGGEREEYALSSYVELNRVED